MTRWNAFSRSFALLHLLTLSSPTSAATFGFRVRHRGKSHQNHIHRAIEARQDIPNAPFAGISMISSHGAIALPSMPAPISSTPVHERFETISAMETAGVGGIAAPSMKSRISPGSSSDRATITSYAPPVFPTTVLQVPIYTICLDEPGYFNAIGLYSNATATRNITELLPRFPSGIPFSVNMTALLSNGSHTTYLSQSLSTPASAIITPTPAPDARIILDSNGCQTLYSASTTQICSTVITRGGQVPISVSDCSQLVTFSSGRATSAPDCNCPDTSMSPTVFLTSSTSSASVAEAEASEGLGMAFYAAPWYEIAAGLVPGLVHVAHCPDESGNHCSTSSESWSVRTSTTTATRTSIVQYTGPAVFVHGTKFLTTSVSYSSLHTWTHSLLFPTIVRAAIAGVTAAPISTTETTVIVRMTLPQVQTWALERIHETTRVTEVVTVTVPGTVRVTHTVTTGDVME